VLLRDYADGLPSFKTVLHNAAVFLQNGLKLSMNSLVQHAR